MVEFRKENAALLRNNQQKICELQTFTLYDDIYRLFISYSFRVIQRQTIAYDKKLV